MRQENNGHTRLSDIVSHAYVSMDGSESIFSIWTSKSVKQRIAYPCVVVNVSLTAPDTDKSGTGRRESPIQALFAASASSKGARSITSVSGGIGGSND